MEKQSSINIYLHSIYRTEMLRFEPEAMRAFVKYKPLKKLIAQSVHKESVESESTSEQPEKDIPSVENNAKAMATY